MPAKKARYSKLRAISEEKDPEWRAFFERIERLRKESANSRKKLIFSRVEKEGKSETVYRKRTEPTLVKKVLSVDNKRGNRIFDIDLTLINNAWRHVVGEEIATDTSVFSFKNGVLTISVTSPILLQELRQFHKSAILTDLRDIWQVSQPLVRVVFRPGKK